MSNINEEDRGQNFALKILTKISDETGVRVEMVGHIRQSITRKRKVDIHIDSKNATRFIILDLINNDNGSVQDILTYNGIHSSDDFGTVVRKLCEEGLLIKEEGDHYDDFKGHFTIDTINDFIRIQKLKKDRDWYKTVCYGMYVTGFGIVVASYITIIPNTLGWSGWTLGMIGWLLLTFRNKIIAVFSK